MLDDQAAAVAEALTAADVLKKDARAHLDPHASSPVAVRAWTLP